MAELIPSLIPSVSGVSAPPASAQADQFSTYDIAVGGVGLMFSNTPQEPYVRETVQLEKNRIDQAQTPGEQTLTSWWIKSQDSFHGGAGQLNLESAFPTQVDHIRYAVSKNLDVWTPGRVERLPDMGILSTDSANRVVAVAYGGNDVIFYLTTGGTVKQITSIFGTPSVTNVTGLTAGTIVDIATDGVTLFAASLQNVYAVDPANIAASTTLASLTAAATVGARLGWVKSRLMVGFDATVYELDVTATAVTLGSGQQRYKHPSKGFVWRCFGESPTAILAAGDALGRSAITQFDIVNVSGAPVVQVKGDIAPLPFGERVLSMVNSQGTFLAVGTTSGVRVGTFDTYTGALTYGPLELTAADPTIPCNALAARDRFIFAAGKDYDEGGLLRVDLGTQIDQAGRYAWAPDMIAPVATNTAATSVCVAPISNRIVMSIPGTGVMVEGTEPGAVREAWLKTSRIRFGTTEAKLFKLGRVRGDLVNGNIAVAGYISSGTFPLMTVGFTTTDPQEFRLPTGLNEWLQLLFTFEGGAILQNYQVKALPGTRRQRHLQFVCAISNRLTSKSGQQISAALSARDTLNALEALDAAGDEIVLQEYTPAGIISTLVVIEMMSFKQVGRPTRTDDIGGDVTLLLRTVES